eukprot:m.824968 g.824968  ORF g.824968 m.824968 type:complete len:604 (-) comp23406_c0_seq28:5205-7016(-)
MPRKSCRWRVRNLHTGNREAASVYKSPAKSPKRIVSHSKSPNSCRARIWSSSKSTCVHNFCSRTKVAQVTIPKASYVGVLRRVQRTERDIKQLCASKHTVLRLCKEHIKDEFFAPGCIQPLSEQFVHFPQEDPIVSVASAGRNAAGNAFAQRYLSRSGQICEPVATDSTNPDENFEMAEKICALKKEILSLKRSHAALRSKYQDAAAEQVNDFSKIQQPYTFQWYLDLSDDSLCIFYTSMRKFELEYYVKSMILGGGKKMFSHLANNQTTKFSYEDALCIALTRLRRMRHWLHFQERLNVDASVVRDNAVRALVATQVTAERTVNRQEDRKSIVRVHSLKGEFGPGGTQGPVEAIIDGFAVRVSYPSPTQAHHKMYSPYHHEAVCQATLVLNSGFGLCGITDFYTGSDSETRYVIDSKILETEGLLNPGDKVMSDKGYKLRTYLEGCLQCGQVKPTEMCKSKISEFEAARSRRIAVPRAASERMVNWCRSWDIFGGKPVHMAEWSLLDTFKDVILSVRHILGPLPDHTGAACTKEQCSHDDIDISKIDSSARSSINASSPASDVQIEVGHGVEGHSASHDVYSDDDDELDDDVMLFLCDSVDT